MEKRRLLMDLLSNTVAFLVFFNLFAFIYAMIHNRMPWIYLLVVIPFFIMLYIRKKVKKMRYFIAAHVPVLAMPLIILPNVWSFLPNVWTFALFVGFATAITIYSLAVKGKGEWNMHGGTAAWVIGVLAALSFLYVTYRPEIEVVGILLNISSLIVLAAVVLYTHLDNMRFGLGLLNENHKKSENISPVSNMLITVFLIIIVIFGALSIFFPSQAAVMILLRLLRDIVMLPFLFAAFILQSCVGDMPLIEDMPLPMDIPLGEGEIEFGEGVEPEEPNMLDTILHTIVGFLAAFGLIAMAAAFVIGLFYRLYKSFFKKDEAGKQSLMPEDAISKLKFVLGDFKELLPRFKIGAKHPVRRAYIKKVNSHIKTGFRVRPHYTPEIISDKIRPMENIDDLTEKYEKVRYGRG